MDIVSVRPILIPTIAFFFPWCLATKTNFGKRFFKIKDCSDSLNLNKLIKDSFFYFVFHNLVRDETSTGISRYVKDLSYIDHYKREESYWHFKTICIIGYASYNVLRRTKSSCPIFSISMISLCSLSTDGFLTYMHLKDRGFLRYRSDEGIDFYGFPELRSLPRGLHVKEIRIEECPNFTTLPEDIRVDGDIILINSINLTSLPENLQFGGDLHLRGCRRLTSLPENITRLGLRSDGRTRLVNLTQTGLSDAYIDGLRNEPAPGMRFLFDRQQEYIPNPPSFNNLREALNFWKNIAPREYMPYLSLEGQKLDDMIIFLNRLTNTAEYRNRQTKQPLATRVLNMVSLISQHNEVKEQALDLIHEGLSSCDDRVIATLDDIELFGRIQDAESESPASNSEKKLRSLGKALYKLEEVRKAAGRHMATLNWVDEVEVQLAFQIGLTETLQLPLSTQNMIFRGCANVTDEQIADAGQKILENCSERNINKFLQSWDPWKRHIRRKIIPNYKALDSVNIDRHVQCDILQEKTEKLVQCKNNFFDYDALCQAYVQSGLNPCSRQPINWREVKRLTKQCSR